MKRVMLLAALGVALAASSVHAAETYKEAFSAARKKYKARDYKGAKESFGEALKLAETASDKASALLYMGYAAYSLKDYDDALGFFEKAAATEDASPSIRSNAHLYVGHSLDGKKEYDKALAAYEKVAAIPKGRGRDKAVALTCAGLIYGSRKKDVAKARAEFEKVLAMDSARGTYKGRAAYELGKTYVAEKLWDKARECFAKTAAMPGVSDYYVSWSRYMIGECYRNEKKHKEARAEYDKVVNMKGGSTTARKRAQRRIADVEIARTIQVIQRRLVALKAKHSQLSGIANARTTGLSLEYNKGTVSWPQGKGGGPKFSVQDGCRLRVHLAYPVDKGNEGAMDQGCFYRKAKLSLSFYLFTTGAGDQIRKAVRQEVKQLAARLGNK